MSKIVNYLLLIVLNINMILSIGSGKGWASRYWDCCKPSCSWTNNSGEGNEARSCYKDGSVIKDSPYEQSICTGNGEARTCMSQIPWYEGDTGYAFGAVPGADATGTCGTCYQLTFTGEGNFETTGNHKALKGKKLIIMASNIGYDVEGGQFDIMIPGGGVGAFDGCQDTLGNMGERYGGLLSDCEKEIGYSGDDDSIYKARKDCLSKKCSQAFSGKGDALKGCMFLVDFMEAAGNPSLTYEPVSCPASLKEKY